jgi:N-acetylmuramoyl-L-alanine amidase
MFALTLSLALLAAPAAAQPPQKFVVVLDAAHGGDDIGAKLEDNQLEKNFTLAFSVRLRSLLGARGIQVVTTREQDVTVEAEHRAAVANHANAQACLTLHATESGQGVHLYVSSVAPAEPHRFVAWKTAQAAWVARSVTLAGVLNSALTHGGITVLNGRVGLPGLDSMSCPAVAVEIAPETMSSRTGSNGALDDPDYQARIANALAAALLEWRTEGHPQ